MKKSVLVSLVSLFSVISTHGQKLTEKDVNSSKELTFYGYDYTHFTLADPKRMGQNIKNFIFIWNEYCNKSINEKNLKKCFNKEKVTINQEPTIKLNKRLNSDDLGSMKKNILSKDSIQNCINNYSISEKEGLGFVIIYECYDNDSKTISAYYSFFDIGSKQIIRCDYFTSKYQTSYNRVNDWAIATIGALNNYIKFFKKVYK